MIEEELSIKKQSNKIISKVYHQILKVECDELIDDNQISISQLKYDDEVRYDVYLKFYHQTTYNLLKTHIGINIEKPIVFFKDLEIIDYIDNQLIKIISDDEWLFQLQLINRISNMVFEGKTISSISKETNLSSSVVVKYYNISTDRNKNLRLEYLKNFRNRDYLKVLKSLSVKLKWGCYLFHQYYKSNDSYVIELLGDGRGMIYDSIHQSLNTIPKENEFIILPSEFIDELIFKVDKHHFKLSDRIKSYCGWKIKQRSFEKFRLKGEYQFHNRIIRYMVVKEYGEEDWIKKLYSDLLHRGLISKSELVFIQIKLFSLSDDFINQIKDVVNEVLIKYDYRDKPNVISVDINKFFRIKSKYKSILNR